MNDEGMAAGMAERALWAALDDLEQDKAWAIFLLHCTQRKWKLEQKLKQLDLTGDEYASHK